MIEVLFIDMRQIMDKAAKRDYDEQLEAERKDIRVRYSK